MEWVILPVLVVFLIFGYFIVDKLDKFLASSHFAPNLHIPDQENIPIKNALVFGKQDLSDEITDLLEKQNITYEKVTDFNQLKKSLAYDYLFAVDDNDFENLMACSFCEKMFGITKRVAICNCFDNLRIFKDNHIPYLCGYSVSASALVAELIPSLQADGGNSDGENTDI